MGNAPIVLEILVEAPIGDVWKAWTDQTALTTWLTPVAKVELATGGAFELFWEPEHPERNSTIGCSLTLVEHHRKLGFTWKGPVQFADLMNAEPTPTSVAVEFEDVDGRKTRIRLNHSGWGNGERWRSAREWQEQAWLMAFEELKKKEWAR